MSFRFEDFRIWENRISLPIVFSGFLWLKVLGLSGGVLHGMFAVPIHEMGHAIIAWMGGRAAIPTFFYVTIWSGEQSRSLVIWLIGVALVLFLLYRCLRGGFYFGSFLWALTFILQLRFYFCPLGVYEKWIKLNGLAAELWLSALLVCLFYYRAPNSWENWRSLRYFFLLAGAFTFVENFLLWRRARVDISLVPWGSALAGENDENGDLNSLNSFYSWDLDFILSFYNQLATICLIVILLHYVAFFFVSSDRQFSETDEDDFC